MLDPYFPLNTYINFKRNKKLSVKNEIKYCTKKINDLMIRESFLSIKAEEIREKSDRFDKDIKLQWLKKY